MNYVFDGQLLFFAHKNPLLPLIPPRIDMTANLKSQLDEGYGIAALFLGDEDNSNTDAEIKQDVEELQSELQLIRDRMKHFEEKFSGLIYEKNQPPSHNQLIGPTNKSFNELSNTDSDVVLDLPEQAAIGENELNQVFGNYEKPEEIDGLKRQLEEKLRSAEVEMSIQRARVFQQRAELEEMRLQLEQREAAIQKTVDNQTGNRWDRHFGFARQK